MTDKYGHTVAASRALLILCRAMKNGGRKLLERDIISGI